MKVTSVASYADIKQQVPYRKDGDDDRCAEGIFYYNNRYIKRLRRIVPTSEANEAAAIKKISRAACFFAAEMGAKKVSGCRSRQFPAGIHAGRRGGRVLIYSTTNGSTAVKSLADAEDILIGRSLTHAAAKMAYSLKRDIMLVCAGTKGYFSTDDIVALGCIVSRLLQMDDTIEIDDLGKVARKLYIDAKNNIMEALEGSSNYEYLKELQLFDDLEYCTREDMFDIVPVYKEGVIVK
jgi:2-phosphosulfolactate phosphatase